MKRHRFQAQPLSHGEKLLASTRPAKYEHLAMQWRIRKKIVTRQRNKLRIQLAHLREALKFDPANELLIFKRTELREKIRTHNAEMKVLAQARLQLERMETEAWHKQTRKKLHAS